MAMDKDVLGLALKNRILSMVPSGVVVPSGTQATMEEFWKAVADEIIKHIQQNGIVNVTCTGTASGGVCSGSGTGTVS
jgi:hypothetical protein